MAQSKLLILGGTSEAVALAHALIRRFGDRLTVISSLAGVTETAVEIPGVVRRGGFGGLEGLTDYLREESIDLIIDASHPFAANISQHGREASTRLGLPRLTLLRPEWPRLAGEWRFMVPDMAAAAARLTKIGAQRILVTTGAKDLAKLADVPQAWFLIRLIEPLAEPLPISSYALIFARGPFTSAGERKMMEEHGIDALLTKDSGGHLTFGKIVAARDLGLPVVMIGRPETYAADSVETIEAALDWVETQLGP
jgi:precorrin-6A/cobalt-precorrin-6A reductase